MGRSPSGAVPAGLRTTRFGSGLPSRTRAAADLADYIKNLEEQYEEAQSRRPATPAEGGGELPSAEDLLSGLEGFLRDQRDEG